MMLAEKIHSDGRKLYSYPFRVYWLDCMDGEKPPVCVISVPKKLFRRAVKRNLIRRRTREAFRHIYMEYPAVESKHIMLVYTATEILDYGKISEGLGSALGKIQ